MVGMVAGRGMAGRTAVAGMNLRSGMRKPTGRSAGARRATAGSTREAGTEDLEARLAELRDEVRRVEAELVSFRGSDETASERP
jgi:uncharacterized small protein (DUF1192 family)